MSGERAAERGISNQRLQRFLARRVVQPKLTVNAPGDEYEREAERVSEAVMSVSEREVVDNGSAAVEKVQRRETSGQPPAVDAGVERQIDSVRGGGTPLPASVRTFFEPRFGEDFSDVRVHTDARADAAARAVRAEAFTVGRDVVFRSGAYRPDTEAGKRLLAHELTHVVQQDAGGFRSVQRQSAMEMAVRLNIPETTREMRSSGYGTTYVFDGQPFHLWPAQEDAVIDFLVETAREIWSNTQSIEASYESLFEEEDEPEGFVETVGAGMEQFAQDVTEAFSGSGAPPQVRPLVRLIRSRIDNAEAALNNKNLDIAVGMIESAGETYGEMADEWNDYIRANIETGEHIVTTLEWTRDLSSAVVTALAGVATGGSSLLVQAGAGATAAGGMELATRGAQQSSSIAVGLRDSYDVETMLTEAGKAAVIDFFATLIAGPLLEKFVNKFTLQLDVYLRGGSFAQAGEDFMMLRNPPDILVMLNEELPEMSLQQIRRGVLELSEVRGGSTGISVGLEFLRRAVETGVVKDIVKASINSLTDPANATPDEVVNGAIESIFTIHGAKRLLVTLIKARLQ